MRIIRSTAAALTLTLATAAVALAQAKPVTEPARHPGFGISSAEVGPVLGFGGLGDAGISFGGRFEKGIKQLGDDGTLSIQGAADWYSYSYDYQAANYDFTYIPLAATANFHFRVGNGKWDPFLGAGLGYNIVSTSYAGDYDSGIFFVGRAGVKYYTSSGLAFYGDLGTGAAAVNLGVMFRLAK